MSLHVRLFGAIELFAEDQPLPRMATAKAEALLAYLLVEEALRPGASHHREGLMTLLWPDMPLESAQLNLRQTLYRVRQGLPDDAAMILSNRQSVHINPAAAYGCDVAEFLARLNQAEQQQQPARTKTLATAAALYRDDLLASFFLPDSESFETWAQTQRQRFRQQAQDALSQLAGHALDNGDYDAAAAFARRQIEIDNLAEPAHRQLMIALAASGQRNAALVHFGELRQLLTDELAAEPDPETTALFEAIRTGDLVGPTEQPVTQPQPRAARPDDAAARRILLDKVRTFWVVGVLEQSLHGAALIDLSKEPQPGALAHPWEMVVQRPDLPPLPANQSILDTFDDAGQALLILGAPGAGKTTTLLELARQLLDRAAADPFLPIPVVFNLSSWSERQPSLDDWLVEELNAKYLIPHKIGRAWIETDQILLLLDGLDEMRQDAQATCGAAVNQFRRKRGLTPIAVCCRAEEYELLPEPLELNNALLLQPLEDEQVSDYIRAGGTGLNAVADLLAEDADLRALMHSPLMLNIAALAYRDATSADLAQLQSSSDRRNHIFAAYVQQMFRRRGKRATNEDVPPVETTHYLSWLARSMTSHGQAVFLLEQLQIGWLHASSQRWLYAILSRTVLGLVMSMIFLVGFAELALRTMNVGVVAACLLMGLIVGAAVGVFTAVGFERQVRAGPGTNISHPRGWRLLVWMAALGLFTFATAMLLFQAVGASFEQASSAGYGNALAFVLFFGLDSRRTSGLRDIHPVETLTWSWPAGLRGSIPGLVLGAAVGLLDQYVTGSNGQSSVVVIFAAVGGLMTGLIGGLRAGVIPVHVAPNQGMRLSLRYSLLVGSIFAVVAALVMVVVFRLAFGASAPFSAMDALQVGVALGGAAWLGFGGIALINHAMLRLLLWQEGAVPLRYSRFLDACVDLIFLRRVGGGYIFVHPLLQAHFAALDTNRQAIGDADAARPVGQRQ